MSDPTLGEAGGLFAGCVALLIAFGHGIRWLLGYGDRRDQTRSGKLDAWHRELEARERRIEKQQRDYQDKIERRLRAVTSLAVQLHTEHSALRNAYQLIATALRSIDEQNPALRMADEMIRSAFPLDPKSPPDMMALLAEIEDADAAGDPAPSKHD